MMGKESHDVIEIAAMIDFIAVITD